MSQSTTSDQTGAVHDDQAVQDPSTQVKSSWGRTLALVGVGLFVGGLFLGGLLKGSENGAMIVKGLSFTSLACIAVGLLGVGVGAMRKRGVKSEG